MKTRRLILCALCLALLLLCIVPAQAEGEEPEPEAADITKTFLFETNGKAINAYYSHDGKLVTHNVFKPDDVLHIWSRSGDIAMNILYFRLGMGREGSEDSPFPLTIHDALFEVRQYDQAGELLLSSEVRVERLGAAVYLAEGCCAVEVVARSVFSICELSILGPGRLPDKYPIMEPSVERTDFLIIGTHPDDEWIFLGAVYPIYGAERGYTGTFAYVTSPSWGRVHEAINSVWSAGIHTLPYFLGFRDVYTDESQWIKDKYFKKEDVTLALVRLYRKIKPLVVVTQDPVKGEYGHWQHIVGARAAFNAVALAQDPEYDPESVAEYGVWEVKKLYQHLAQDGRIMLDINAPLEAYGGMTAFQVAWQAYQEDVSQHRYAYRPKNDTTG